MRGSRAILRRIESRALVSSGCKVADSEFCGAKLTTTFTFSGSSRCSRSTGGSCLNGSLSAGARPRPAAMSSAICLSLAGRLASVSQLEEQTRSVAVAHQPVDVVLSFAHVESALQKGGRPGIVFDGRHGHVLREVDRLVGLVLRHHAENHGELVLRASQFLERNSDIVAGMKLQVEAERRFGGHTVHGRSLRVSCDSRMAASEPKSRTMPPGPEAGIGTWAESGPPPSRSAHIQHPIHPARSHPIRNLRTIAIAVSTFSTSASATHSASASIMAHISKGA